MTRHLSFSGAVVCLALLMVATEIQAEKKVPVKGRGVGLFYPQVDQNTGLVTGGRWETRGILSHLGKVTGKGSLIVTNPQQNPDGSITFDFQSDGGAQCIAAKNGDAIQFTYLGTVTLEPLVRVSSMPNGPRLLSLTTGRVASTAQRARWLRQPTMFRSC